MVAVVRMHRDAHQRVRNVCDFTHGAKIQGPGAALPLRAFLLPRVLNKSFAQTSYTEDDVSTPPTRMAVTRASHPVLRRPHPRTIWRPNADKEGQGRRRPKPKIARGLRLSDWTPKAARRPALRVRGGDEPAGQQHGRRSISRGRRHIRPAQIEVGRTLLEVRFPGYETLRSEAHAFLPRNPEP